MNVSAPIDLTKSVKLQQYFNSQNLTPEDNKFLNEVDTDRLFDEDTYNSIKYKTEAYRKIKADVAAGLIPTDDIKEKMDTLQADVLYESNGQDIEKINLSDLHSTTRLDAILRDRGVSSKNDIRVRIANDGWLDDAEFKTVELVSSNEPWSYGILPTAKMAVLENGKIIVRTNSLYRK